MGRSTGSGWISGSKAELLIAMAHNPSDKAALICNGVKDEEFIRLALMSLRLGFNTFIVLESPRELELVLAVADAMQVRPQLGIRIKLTHGVSGNGRPHPATARPSA